MPLEVLARAEGGLQQELTLLGPCPGPKIQTMQCYATPIIVGAPFFIFARACTHGFGVALWGHSMPSAVFMHMDPAMPFVCSSAAASRP